MNTNLNNLWSSLLVEELTRNGINHFCLASGSRSSPVIASVARHPQTKKIVHFDERGAAFHALGYGRATGKAAVVVTTSGTALANTWPAVVEASMDRLPLMILSADRPPELRDTGANQTIDQVKFFGDYIRWQVDLPCPDEKIAPEFLLTAIDQAIYRSQQPLPGPVHINAMFREPLVTELDPKNPQDYLSSLAAWGESKKPFTRYSAPTRAVPEEVLKEIASILHSTEQGILVIGALSNERDRNAALQWVEQLRWPVFADITSGLRFQSSNNCFIPYYDALLNAKNLPLEPKVVLHIGGRVTSKRLLEYLEKQDLAHYILVNDHPTQQDPLHQATLKVETDIHLFCDALRQKTGMRSLSPWLQNWKAKSNHVDSIFEETFPLNEKVSEPGIARWISKIIPKEQGLFLSSSLPIREFDLFAAAQDSRVPTAANRGASGIDGTLASASGFAQGLQRPVTVVLGDLALLHDLNSLALIRSSEIPVITVVFNNNGGGIFSFLPIAEFKDIFEPYFGTPHQLNFKSAAKMFELEYHCPKTIQDFVETYSEACNNPKSTLIEIQTDREENYALHQKLLQR